MKKFIISSLFILFSIVKAWAQDVTLNGPAACNGTAISGTWTVPCNVTAISIQVYGGGGGAGGGGGGSNGGFCNTRGGGGGGAAGFTTRTFSVIPGSTFSYSIGAGGCGGGNGSDSDDGDPGTTGGNTSFSGTDSGGNTINLVANGGLRGREGESCGGTGAGGAGGTASGGTTNTTGASGNGGSGGNGGAGGTAAGPNGGAGGVGNGNPGATYGGGGAGGGNSPGGRGAAGGILITYTTTIPLPATPIISSVPATCLNAGSSTISNYDASTTYTFSPTGPTVGAGGIISGMAIGTNYTVVAGTGPCASSPSASFSNAAQTSPPADPIITTTAASCSATGTATITNYNASYTYIFNPTGPSVLGNGTINGLTPNTNYTVLAEINGCSSNPSNSFSVATQLPNPTASINGNLSYCPGSNTTLTASGGVSYIWADAGGNIIGNNPSVTVTQGTYAVLVTNANGCNDTAIATVTAFPALSLAINGSLSYCSGSNTTITATGGNTYLWNDINNSNTAAITITQGSYSVTATDANGCTATATTTVTENALPNINIAGNTSYCEGSNTTLTATGGTNYVWSGSGSSNSATITATQGNYTVTGTDINGCSASSSVTVTENAQPVIAISGSLTYCIGGNTTLTASGGTSYLWSNLSTNAAITVTQGNYSVTVTGVNGCTATASASVTESTSLTVNITGSLTYCPNNNTIITANGGVSYLWSNGNTTATINVTAGNYTVTAIDAIACTGTATVSVVENNPPTITISGSLIYCEGSNTTLTASGGLNFIWSNGNTTASVNVSQGNYTVTGTDVNGCTASTSETVLENVAPVIDISGLLTYCTGGNTTLTASGGVSYLWSEGSTTNTITVTQGNFSVTGTDANGCTASTSVTTTESSVLSVSINGSLNYCPDSNTILTATGGSSYTWSNGNTTDTITATAGTYTVTATDGSCSGTATVTVSIFSLQPLPFDDEVAVCEGLSVEINAGNNYTNYNWNTGDTSAIISPTLSGVYTVSATDVNGCTNIDSISVSFTTPPTIDLGNDTAITSGASITILPEIIPTPDNNTVFSWQSDAVLSCNDCATTIVTINDTSTVTLTYTDAFGCIVADSITINVLPLIPVYIPNAFSPNGDGENDIFKIYGSGFEQFYITIHNRWGQQVFATEDVNFIWDGTFKGKEQEQGVYVYYVKAEFADLTIKTLKGSLTLMR